MLQLTTNNLCYKDMKTLKNLFQYLTQQSMPQKHPTLPIKTFESSQLRIQREGPAIF